MKLAWAGGKRASFIFGDAGYKFLNVLPDVSLNDYGIFLGDAGRDDALKQQVQQMSQAALQSGSLSLLDALKVLKSDTMTEAQHVLEKGLEAMQEQQQQAQQQQAQMQQAQAEADQQKTQGQIQLKEMEVQGNIQVAQINAEARVKAQEIASDTTRDVEDSKERNKLSLEKIKADFGSQQKEVDNEHSLKVESKKEANKK